MYNACSKESRNISRSCNTMDAVLVLAIMDGGKDLHC